MSVALGCVGFVAVSGCTPARVPSPRAASLATSVANVHHLQRSAYAGERVSEQEAIVAEWNRWAKAEVRAAIARGDFERADEMVEKLQRRSPEPPDLYAECRELAAHFERHDPKPPTMVDPYGSALPDHPRRHCSPPAPFTWMPGFVRQSRERERDEAVARGHLQTAALFDSLLRTLPERRFTPHPSLSVPPEPLRVTFEGASCPGPVPEQEFAGGETVRVLLDRCDSESTPVQSRRETFLVEVDVPVYETREVPVECRTTSAVTEQQCIARSANGTCLQTTTVTVRPAETDCRGGGSAQVVVGTRKVKEERFREQRSQELTFRATGRLVHTSPDGTRKEPVRIERTTLARQVDAGPWSDSIASMQQAAFAALLSPIREAARQRYARALPALVDRASGRERENLWLREWTVTRQLRPEAFEHFRSEYGLEPETVRAILEGRERAPTPAPPPKATSSWEPPDLRPDPAFVRALVPVQREGEVELEAAPTRRSSTVGAVAAMFNDDALRGPAFGGFVDLGAAPGAVPDEGFPLRASLAFQGSPNVWFVDGELALELPLNASEEGSAGPVRWSGRLGVGFDGLVSETARYQLAPFVRPQLLAGFALGGVPVEVSAAYSLRGFGADQRGAAHGLRLRLSLFLLDAAIPVWLQHQLFEGASATSIGLGFAFDRPAP